MIKKKTDYLTVVYNESDRPLTDYPLKLTKYLTKIYDLKQNAKLLDIGCGRGEFLSGFTKSGLDCYGVDQFKIANKYFPDAKITVADLENEKLPYQDNSFDIVFSKSFIEHFYYPEKIAKEIFRVLKPNGITITLTPDWHFHYRDFYDDYTHRTAFTFTSLKDFLLIHNFDNVSVTRFKQLPILWKKNLLLSFLSELTRILSPNFLKKYSKWIRFSKEIMILSSANKPKN